MGTRFLCVMKFSGYLFKDNFVEKLHNMSKHEVLKLDLEKKKIINKLLVDIVILWYILIGFLNQINKALKYRGKLWIAAAFPGW